MSKNKDGMKILKYDENQILDAIQAVQNGMPILEASKRYKVPRTTLTYKLSGRYPIERKMGPASYISKEHEGIIVRWILESQKKGFPISRHQLVESVKKLVTDLNLKTPFKNNKPGKKWVELFLKRHPEISERIPQTLTVPRATISKEKLFSWFEEIEAYVSENNLTEVIADPVRVFNADESAFFLNPQGGKVLARKGDKNVYQMGNDEKECLTFLFTANAAGMMPPPMIVFRYDRVPSYVVSSVPEAWGIGRSESGWMCGPTFFEYMANIFKPWLDQNNIPRPVIFFIDGHVSHLTLHVSQFCSENGIILICLVANATHIMQPMDVAVFRPLKTAWKESTERFKNDTKVATIKKEHAGMIMKKALDNTDLKDTISNGFRACGLVPFTKDGIDLGKLLHKSNGNEENEVPVVKDKLPAEPSTISHLKFIESMLETEKVNSFQKCIGHGGKWTGSASEESLFHFYKKVFLLATSDGAPSTSESVDMVASTSDSVSVNNSDIPMLTSTPNNSPVKDQQATTSFEGLLPSPFKRSLCWPEVTVKKTNKRKREHIPFVVSSTAYQEYYAKKLAKKKEDEEAKQKRKEERELKKSQQKKSQEKKCQQKKKTKKQESSSSESELSESQMSLHSDTESEDFESEHDQERGKGEVDKSNNTVMSVNSLNEEGKPIHSESSVKCPEEIKPLSFVIVNYEEEFFPGQVIKINKGQYYVKAMGMSGYNWKWPVVEDICWYDQCDVIQAINAPQKINERGTFRVPEIDALRNMKLK